MLQALFLLRLLACGVPTAGSLDASETVLLCESGDPATLVLEGDAIAAVITGVLTDDPTLHMPILSLEPSAGLAAGSSPSASRAVQIPDTHWSWTEEGKLELLLDGELGLSAGAWDVVLTDPFDRQSRVPEAVIVTGTPSLDAVEPEGTCHDQAPTALLLSGSGFLEIAGQTPTVRVGPVEVPLTALSGCEPLAGGLDGRVCTGGQVDIDPQTLPLGWLDVYLRNPAPGDCEPSQPARVEIQEPPTITGLEPAAVCRYGGGFDIVGERFEPGATVSIDGEVLTDVTLVDSSRMRVNVGEHEPGLYDVVVSLPNGCTSTLPEGLSVAEAPIIFTVDPPIVYGGLAVEVTATIADVTGEITDVWLERISNGEVTEVTWTWDPASPSLLRAVIPATVTPAEYYLRFVQAGECQGDVGATVRVRQLAPVAIESVDPPYAWSFDNTAVTIYASDPIPTDMVGFAATPSVYLVGPGGDPSTTQVFGVTYLDEHRLTATIPDGLAEGRYHMVVINPDESLGHLARAIEVTEEGPPRIESVSPAALPNSSNQTVQIRGRNFRDPSVEIECLESGTTTTASGTVESSNYARINVSLPTSRYNRAVCTLRVTNSDGTSGLFSAISITNPAQNLFPWQAGTEMVEARRAPAGVAGRSSSVNRYVYAIGGDEGDSTSAKDSIEVARIGVYGEMESFRVLEQRLNRPRTLAAAVAVGRFIYVVGGNNGSRVVEGVGRAMILDPVEIPVFSGLSIARGDALGLEAGDWSYRIAGLYAADDEMNPGGESLPSESMSVRLPDVGTRMRPTLTWQPLDRTVGYRVYRNATPGGTDWEWLADVSTNSFTDDGGATDPSLTPLSEGALGNFATLDPLPVAREGACLAVGFDPSPDPEIYYLYVAGGRDESGNLLDTIDYLDIQIGSSNEHYSGTWAESTYTLDTPRWQCSGFTVDSQYHTVVDDDETWIYFAGGLTDRNATGEAQAGRIDRGGELTDWQSVDSLSPARAGFAVASASNFLYAFGGHNGTPSASGTSAELQTNTIPSMRNWNSLSISMTQERYLAGSAQQSAVIFVLGGQTDSEDATRSTDFTNF